MKLPVIPSVLALCALFAARAARADDWLAALPECAGAAGTAQRGPERPAIEYPRPGLPAVVAAGQLLVARVQLPLPLTPPPGVQQERALRGYSAELRAATPSLHAVAKPPAPVAAQASTTPGPAQAPREDAPPAHHYRVEVIRVRPDGASSMRYRVTFHVPAWTAPGVYALKLVAAGVALPAEAPVVVLPQGAAPRLRPLELEPDADAGATALPAGARAPVDVWVRTGAAGAPGAAGLAPSETATRPAEATSAPGSMQLGAPAAQPGAATSAPSSMHLGAPVLDPRGLVAALRVGAGLWVLGDCPGPHLPFADEVRSVLGVERRTQLDAPPYVAAPATVGAAEGEAAVPLLQLQAAPAPDGGLVLHARTGGALELSLVVAADGRPLHAEGGVLELYPATELPPAGRTPTLIARWRLAAGVAGQLVQAKAPASAQPALPVDLQPNPVRSGHLLRVSPRPLAGTQGAPDVTPLLAVRFDERSTAFGRGEASHRFTALGPARLHTLALLPDGRAVNRVAAVEVVTEAAVGCSATRAAPSPRASAGGWPVLSLWTALWLLKRRPPRVAGNRLGSRSRSPQKSRRACTRIPPRRSRTGALVKRPHWPTLLLCLASLLAAAGCAHKPIPNTRVEDTEENREVIDFVEKYRKAVEARDSVVLLRMTSRMYFDDMGTPQGDDDVDYDALQAGLGRLQKELLDARYQISYRGVTYTPNDRVLVDMLYTGWFKVETPTGPEWRRKLEPHRIVLAREDGNYKIVSGM